MGETPETQMGLQGLCTSLDDSASATLWSHAQVRTEAGGEAKNSACPPRVSGAGGVPWGQGRVWAGALQLKFKCLSSRLALPLNEPQGLSKLKSTQLVSCLDNREDDRPIIIARIQ